MKQNKGKRQLDSHGDHGGASNAKVAGATVGNAPATYASVSSLKKWASVGVGLMWYFIYLLEMRPAQATCSQFARNPYFSVRVGVGNKMRCCCPTRVSVNQFTKQGKVDWNWQEEDERCGGRASGPHQSRGGARQCLRIFLRLQRTHTIHTKLHTNRTTACASSCASNRAHTTHTNRTTACASPTLCLGPAGSG